MSTDPEDYNDLQAYLEGDARQQDAAMLRLDRRAVEAGQMSVAVFRRLHPDGGGEDMPVPGGVLRLLPSQVSYEQVPICWHPNAAESVSWDPSRATYRKTWTGGRLRVRRCRPVSFRVLRCPDCRTWAGQVEIPGLVTDLRLPPCLLPTTGATPRVDNGAGPCP